MSIEIEWNKILTQAVGTLVTAIVIGACVIVWRGASSVDSKVQQTREDVQHLIDTLSNQLASNQVQLDGLSKQFISVSNQLTVIQKAQASFPSLLLNPVGGSLSLTNKPMVSLPEEQTVRQRVYRDNIRQSLEPPKK